MMFRNLIDIDQWGLHVASTFLEAGTFFTTSVRLRDDSAEASVEKKCNSMLSYLA